MMWKLRGKTDTKEAVVSRFHLEQFDCKRVNEGMEEESVSVG